MSKNSITSEFSVHMAEQFYESLTENDATTYYVVASKTTPYENDAVIPEPNISLSNGFIDIYNNMVFGKLITPNDVSYMVKNIPWVSGNTYDMYDDKDSDLQNKNYYVVSHEPGNRYSIFKCIYNGVVYNGEEVYIPPVFDQPLSTEVGYDDEYYKTSDGYVWKLMCSMSKTEYEKFATSTYIPIKEITEIKNNAVNGKINHILIENKGSRYNSYAFTNIKQSSVAGNNLIFSLQTDETKDIVSLDCEIDLDDFVEMHNANTQKKIYFLRSNGQIWVDSEGDAIYGYLYSKSFSSIRVIMNSSVLFRKDVVSIFQTTNNVSTGTKNAQATIVSQRRDLIPNLSSNTDFYKNCSFYIRSGKGAGQLRYIEEYVVTGNERRVVINSPFTTIPDASSKIEIAPKVLISGDGSSTDGNKTAEAIALIEESSNSIYSIEIIDGGKNYTYAQATVVGNTGLVELSSNNIILTNNAIIRPIISPIGGHGSDIKNELISKNIGISVEFNPITDEGIMNENAYRQLSVIKDPLFKFVKLNIDESGFIFNDGEKVYQNDYVYGEIHERGSNYIIVKNVKGFFSIGETISSRRVSSNVQADINNIDQEFTFINQRETLYIEMENNGSLGSGFVLNENVYQPNGNASGIISDIQNDYISITNVKGTWMISDDSTNFVAEVIGENSNAVAKILDKKEKQLVDYSGKMIYTENIYPLTRSNNQKETVKMVLNF